MSINLTKLMTFKLSEELHNLLILKSTAVGKNKSEYLRNCILSSTIKTSPQQKAKSKQNMLGEMNKIGNNINQIAHTLNIAKQREEVSEVNFKIIIKILLLIEENLSQILEQK